MMKTLIIAEHDNHSLNHATYHAIAAAQELATDNTLLVIGAECTSVAEEAAASSAIQHVLLADNLVYKHQLAENSAQVVAELAKDYGYILATATTFGKNLLPRVAALVDVGMLSDVIQFITPDTVVRPIYAGNALATIQTSEAIKIITVRSTAFPASLAKKITLAPIEKINTVIPNSLSHFVEHRLTNSVRPELTSARIVISGGRGLKSAENFHLLAAIADRLGAALGASRAAVDAGFAPNDYQVGQTGKVVAPDLYIAVGISGAIQHLAGMKDSKVIVAINNDAQAPIFQVADYGLVGDLFKILPELSTELDKVLNK